MKGRGAEAAPPRSWELLTREFPVVCEAYDALSGACLEAGPIDPTTRALVKLAVSVGGGHQRTVHSHAKKALREGVSPAALRHVAMIALPTIGLPAALDARRWIEESIDEAAHPTAPHNNPGRVRKQSGSRRRSGAPSRHQKSERTRV